MFNLCLRKYSTVHVGHLQLFKPEFYFDLQNKVLKTAMNHLNNNPCLPFLQQQQSSHKEDLAALHLGSHLGNLDNPIKSETMVINT